MSMRVSAITAIEAVHAIQKYPPAQWDRWADQMPMAQRKSYVDTLELLTIQAAMMSGYLDSRHGSGCGDQGHKQAVKDCNKVRIKVRKALGYSLTHPVSF